MKKIQSVLLIVLLSIACVSCDEDAPKTLPSISAITIVNVSDTTVVLDVSITDNGNDDIIESGVCWSTTAPEPLVTDSNMTVEEVEGEFSCTLYNLLSETTYYFRAYAVNSVGISYGAAVIINTLAELPQVDSLVLSEISQTSVHYEGVVSIRGNTAVLAKGVCYSTNPMPTLSDDKIDEGIGVGAFTNTLMDLVGGTKYYIRAFAENSSGEIVYGEEQSFSTLQYVIDYYEDADYGKNILHEDLTSLVAGKSYCLAARLREGAQLRVKIKGGVWWYYDDKTKNWDVDTYNKANKSQWFTATAYDFCALKLFFGAGDVTIEYYENGDTTPTRTKYITIK